MKIIIDFLSKLEPETIEYRTNIAQELSKIPQVEVVVVFNKDKPKLKADIEFLEVSHRYKWKKDCSLLASVKPDAVILFSKAKEQFYKKYQVYIYFEALLEPSLVLTSARKVQAVLKSITKARGILIRTQFLKLFFANHFGVEKEKMIVTGQGFDKEFRRENITSELRIVRRVLSMYRVIKPYIFVFGRLEDNPNVDKIIEAFASIHQKYPPMKLLIASPDFKIGWDNKPQAQNKKASLILDLCDHHKVSRKVVFTGQIDRTHLPAIISNAELSISFAENKIFSRSLVGALGAGSAIIISDTPVLKELALNSTYVVSPKLVDSIVEAFHLLLVEEKERKKLQEKAYLRSHYYTWKKTADRIIKRIRQDQKGKAKERILFLKFGDVNQERIESMQMTLDDYFELTQIKGLIKSTRDSDYVYVVAKWTIPNLFKVFVAKMSSKHTKFFAEISEDSYERTSGGVIRKIISKIKAMILGFYLRSTFKGFVIDNRLLVFGIKKNFNISKEKVFFVPTIFAKKLDRSEVSKLRDSYKLKNYICLTTRVETQQDYNKIHEIASFLYRQTKEFKFLIISSKTFRKPASIDTKILKKVVVLPVEKLDASLLNSRLYFDFRKEINQRDVLKAMKSKNLCIARKTLATRFLIKQGINGYLYSSLETGKIAKQISVLVANKSHINDIRKINHLRALEFGADRVKDRVKEVIKNW